MAKAAMRGPAAVGLMTLPLLAAASAHGDPLPVQDGFWFVPPGAGHRTVARSRIVVPDVRTMGASFVSATVSTTKYTRSGVRMAPSATRKHRKLPYFLLALSEQTPLQRLSTVRA
ncbi:hypothetical protein ACFWVU_28435 [Streptomyces sp. NPDC058686]|uniref:hypothetical protein n=1 Tax=Streptomyces sp. NPDC058686 TaxID=3346599 RepID=UPI003664A482